MIGVVDFDSRRRRRRLFAWIALLCVVTLVAHLLIAIIYILQRDQPAVSQDQNSKTSASKKSKRNLILLFGDGFGPATQTLARLMRAEAYLEKEKLERGAKAKFDQGTFAHHLVSERFKFPKDWPLLPLDTMLIGSVMTRSSSSAITDSAAGATAYSCGLRTVNDYVGIDENKKPCAQILKVARKAGYRTGVITTTDVTDATPAAFTAHAASRKNRSFIFEQQMEGVIDVLLGGGKAYHKTYEASVQNSKGVNTGKNEKVSVIDSISNLPQAKLPVIGLFAPYDLDHVLDRVEQPTLLEMTTAAITRLESECVADNNCPGFVAVVEQGHIDIAAHWSDTASLALETLDLQTVAHFAREFVTLHPESLFLCTADHETGGLSIGSQVTKVYPEYIWQPTHLFKQLESITSLAYKQEGNTYSFQNDVSIKAYQDILNTRLAPNTNFTIEQVKNLDNKGGNLYGEAMALGDLVVASSGVKYSTHGHSAVDVNLYGFGAIPDSLKGVKENAEVGNELFKFLRIESQREETQNEVKDLDPGPTTEEIKSAKKSS